MGGESLDRVQLVPLVYCLDDGLPGVGVLAREEGPRVQLPRLQGVLSGGGEGKAAVLTLVLVQPFDAEDEVGKGLELTRAARRYLHPTSASLPSSAA